MRLNYYEFPEGVDPHTRYLNGASNKGGHCELGHTSCRECAGRSEERRVGKEC